MRPPEQVSALIVEDEPRFREFLADVVRGMDMDARCVGSASAAMSLIGERVPDLVLLDLNLPVVDGMEFLERLAARCPAVQVVIITGFGSLEAARRAIRFGVSDFLTKPCDLGQLEEALDRARRRIPVAGIEAEPGPGDGVTAPLATVEREAIMEALEKYGGNRSEAARKLGISRRALYNKIDEYRRQGHAIPDRLA